MYYILGVPVNVLYVYLEKTKSKLPTLQQTELINCLLQYSDGMCLRNVFTSASQTM